MRAERRAYATFLVADLFLGIEVAEVQEILRAQPLTPVPTAPPAIRGLMNLRGQIVTAIELRRRFDLAEAPGIEPTNVVVRTEGAPVSLLVDEVEDVMEMRAEDFERTPETLQGAVRELARGVYKLDGRLMLVLDTARTVDLGAGRER